MTGNAINAKSVRELSAEELDAVSGGGLLNRLASMYQAFVGQTGGGEGGQGGQGGQNDPAQMFQQIMQQLTQG